MPEKSSPDSEPVWVPANRLMNKNQFPSEQMRQAQIWAARSRICPTCEQPPYKPCLNMTDVNRQVEDFGMKVDVRFTKWPHSPRVDWVRLQNALHQRGYGA